MNNNESLRKKRVLNRIMKYSMIYSVDYFSNLTLQELIIIQKSTLIELSIKIAYKRRNITEINTNDLNIYFLSLAS